MSEAVVAALERLGLSNYEARTFVALQKLGTGSARDVHDVADIPRSQVYGAAESLEGQGLIEVQRSNPITYRPVPLDEARERLADRFERDQAEAFEYLEAVRDQQAGTEEREDIWTISGAAAVTTRLLRLLPEAEDHLVFGVQSADLLPDDVFEAVVEQAAAGVDVYVVTTDEDVIERFEGAGIPACPPPQEHGENDRAGRLLLADDDTVLVSVVGAEEMAIWSTGSSFASVLVQLIRGAVAGGFDAEATDSSASNSK